MTRKKAKRKQKAGDSNTRRRARPAIQKGDWVRVRGTDPVQPLDEQGMMGQVVEAVGANVTFAARGSAGVYGYLTTEHRDNLERLTPDEAVLTYERRAALQVYRHHERREQMAREVRRLEDKAAGRLNPAEVVPLAELTIYRRFEVAVLNGQVELVARALEELAELRGEESRRREIQRYLDAGGATELTEVTPTPPALPDLLQLLAALQWAFQAGPDLTTVPGVRDGWSAARALVRTYRAAVAPETGGAALP